MTPREVTYSTLGTSIAGGPAAAPPPPPPPPAPSITLSSLSGATGTTGVAMNFQAVLANPGTLPLVGTPVDVAGVSNPDPDTVTFALGELNKAFAASWAAAGVKQLRMTAPGGIVSNTVSVTISDPSPPPPPPAPTTATLSGSASATAAVPQNYTATLNTAADQTYTITWSVTGGTPASGTSSITSGNTAASVAVTFPSAGAGSVDFTISPSLTRAGRPISVTVSGAAPPPAPPASGARQFTLISSSSITGARFGAGFAFVRGEIPAGNGVALTGAATQQVVPKNYYSDGSMRFAVVSGTADVVGGTPKVISLAAGTSATGTAPTLADLAATGLTASFGTLANGSAAWTSGDWGSPFEQWESGPVRSTWRYRKQIGSHPHLVAWLEVTLYAGGAVEVLPWVENGYIMVASPNQVADTFSFTLGGSLKFSAALTIKHHQRAPLLTGAALSWWHGATDPGLAIKHDADYLMATEAVQAYSATVSPTDALITSLKSTFTPLEDWDSPYTDDDMGGGGSQPGIGPLPRHDVLHLVSTASATYAAVVRNGYRAGRWGIHYRDEAGGRHKPLLFADYPTHALGANSGVSNTGSGAITTPAAPLGSEAPKWDVAHCPSVGFMAYLVTGRKYHAETCQFAATVNYLDWDATQRGNASAIMWGFLDTRFFAWAYRTLTQALWTVEDADTALQASLRASAENTIGHYHALHCAQASDPRGHIQGGTNYNPAGTGAAYMSRQFMEFFCIGAVGMARAMNLPLTTTGATQLAAFHAYMGKQVTSLLGGSAEYWYINATTAYNSAVSPSATPDWAGGTGPWYTTDAAAYAAAAAVYPTDFAAATPGALGGNVASGATSFWGNLHFALATAVRFNLPGALAGYIRMLGATNYSTLTAGFNADPVWSCEPAANRPPAWLVGKRSDRYIELAGTNITAASTTVGGAVGAGIMDNYSGMVLKEDTADLYAHGGGHAGYSGNEIMKVALLADAPGWVTECEPTPLGSRVSGAVWWGTTGSQKPNVAHTYDAGQYSPQLNRLVWTTMRSPWNFSGTPAGGGITYSYKLDTRAWAQPGTADDLGAALGSTATCKDPAGNIYSTGGGAGGQQINKFVPGSGWTLLVDSGLLNWSTFGALLFDPKRSRMLRAGDYGSAKFLTITTAGAVTDVAASITGSVGDLAEFNTLAGVDTLGGCHVPPIDSYVFPNGVGSAHFRLHAGTWALTKATPDTVSGTVPNKWSPADGLFGKVKWVDLLGGWVHAPQGNSNLWFYRPE